MGWCQVRKNSLSLHVVDGRWGITLSYQRPSGARRSLLSRATGGSAASRLSSPAIRQRAFGASAAGAKERPILPRRGVGT